MEDFSSYIILPINGYEPIIIPNLIPDQTENTADDKVLKNVEYVLTQSSLDDFRINTINQTETDSSEPQNDMVNNIGSSADLAIECQLCKIQFSDYNQYTSHFNTQHKEPHFNCLKCEKTFEDQKSYHKHLWTHLEEKQFNCSTCGSAFNHEVNFKIHMVLHEKTLNCPICNLSFQRVASLKSHLAVHQIEEMNTCYKCFAEFENLVDLKKHIKKHTHELEMKSKNLVCNYCKVKFDTADVLREHVSCHMKVKKLVFTGKKNRRLKTGNKENKHKCSVCSKSFPKLSLLERHFRIHSGERPFKCGLCNKGFTQKVTLNHHLTKHAALKPYHCTLCPASFNQKINLKVHVMKTHMAEVEGEKSFKCLHCNCIFKKISSLNTHMTKFHVKNNDEITVMAVVDQLKNLNQLLSKKTSTEELKDTNSAELQTIKDQTVQDRISQNADDEICEVYSLKQKWIGTTKFYVCFFCNKEAKKPSDIIRHIKTHSKEKSFKCFCGKTFSAKTNLVSHMGTHKKKIERKCPHCLKVFYSLKGFNVHTRKFDGQCCEKSDQNTDITRESAVNTEDKRKKELMYRAYRCEICPAAFTKQLSLKNHMVLHSRKNSHQCIICSRVFATAACLEKHSRIHFSSESCNAPSDQSLLKNNVNATRPFECPYCKKRFRSMLICRKHIDTHRKLYEKNEDDVRDELQCDQLGAVLRIDSNGLIIEDTSDTNRLNDEKVATFNTSSRTLKLFGDQDSQTIYLDCSGIQAAENQNQCLLSHLELQPNGTVLVNNSDGLEDTSIVLSFPNMVTETLSVDNVADYQLLRSIVPEKTCLSVAPNPNSLLKRNLDLGSNLNDQEIHLKDLSDTFLTDNLSLYPNTEISFDRPAELDSNSVDISRSLLEEQNLGIKINSTDVGQAQKNINPNPIYSDIVSQKCSQNLDISSDKTSIPVTEKDLEMSSPDSSHENKTKEKITKVKTKRSVQFNCVYCGKDFNNRALYIVHVNTHKKNGDKHFCKFCDKQFKKPSDLQRHLRTHTGEKPYACDQCEKKFSLKSTLESHYKTHNPGATKDFLCEVCNSFFSSKASRKLHMLIHIGMKPFKCNYCDQHFRTSAHKRSHEQKSHINNAGKKTQSKQKKVQEMLTSVADLATSNMADLQDAVLPETTNMKDLQIQLDSQVDSDLKLSEPLQVDQSLLQQLQGYGILVHDIDEDVLQSSVIQVNDSLPQTLDSLELMDEANFQPSSGQPENDKNFECDICHKKSASKDSLRKHIQLHSKKKFVCEQCNKWFTSVEALTEHEKLHSGYRPFSCFLCANSFAELQHLKSHLTRIHQIMDTNSSVIQFSTGESLFI